MNGWFADTDYDWYRTLAGIDERAGLDEVNFWQPSGGRDFRAIPEGAPFFFKLKRPHYAVAGFGFFARRSALPISVAWETFLEKNGAASLEEMRERIARYRSLAPAEDPAIGCLMIAEPVFLPETAWIRQPADWPRNVVQGKTYSLLEGEGRRVWDLCAGYLRAAPLVVGDGTPPPERFGSPALHRPRLGQGTFRIAVMDAYARACAITQEHSLPALEAAHIRPYGKRGSHDPSNGVLLRADLHRLFDKGYVTITPAYRFQVSPRLRADWKNGRAYYPLDGKEISVPKRSTDRPDAEALRWHNEAVFLS
ncbi:MAG: HNH endonuclease [Planctomycetes bacterium]|nr:HNH endonuclease [Planctomycetota bacterium]